MGLIARRVAEYAETRFNAAEWLNDDDYAPGSMTTAGVRVTGDSAMTVSAFWRCVDILASAAAIAPKDVIVKVRGQSFPEFNLPRWMSTPDPRIPSYTFLDYCSDIAVSMLLDGNYFVSAYPYVDQAEVLTVLVPGRCVPRTDGKLDLLDESGRVERTLQPDQFLHGKLLKMPGSLRGLSPLEKFRRSVGSAIAAEDYAARFFGQGATLAFGVEVPYAMDPQKLNDLRESLKAKYVGLRNSHAIGVLADGGKFVTGLAPTPEDAQMLETRKFAVEDIARIFGVPPGMLGSQEPGASSYASAETWKDAYKEITLMPLIARIEEQHSRLLSVPGSITDPNASVQFKVNLDAYLRVDPLKRMQAYREAIQAGVYTPNHARGLEDLAPLPGGDQLYMQAQMTPITQLGIKPPADSSATSDQEAAA